MLDLSQETEALARRIAEVRHITVDDTIRQALQASADASGLRVRDARPRDLSQAAAVMRRKRMEKAADEFAAMPVLDRRTPREIMDDLNTL
jgi:antitoxin VapB